MRNCSLDLRKCCKIKIIMFKYIFNKARIFELEFPNKLIYCFKLTNELINKRNISLNNMWQMFPFISSNYL